MLQSVQKLAEKHQAASVSSSTQLMESEARAAKLEQKVFTLQADLHGLKAAAEEWKEREDDLLLQVSQSASLLSCFVVLLFPAGGHGSA